jgi:hypothetical protein
MPFSQLSQLVKFLKLNKIGSLKIKHRILVLHTYYAFQLNLLFFLNRVKVEGTQFAFSCCLCGERAWRRIGFKCVQKKFERAYLF